MTTCSTENKKLAVSVADALLFDTSCGGEQLILNAKTLMNSSISQAIQETIVYGGKGSQTQGTIPYQKEVSVTLEDSLFSPVYLAVQNGTNIAQELTKFYTQEAVTFDAQGTAKLSTTPSGNVQVGVEEGQFMTVIPVGDSITVTSMADKTAQVVYAEEGMHDTISIDAKSFPKAMKLVLNIDIFDDNGLAEQMQIVIPKFKPDGNMELSFTHDGVATSNMAGKALSDCGNYAKISFKKVNQGVDAKCFAAIYADPNAIELDSTVTGDSVAIAVRGVRQGIYGNITLDNSKLVWTIDDPAVATVINGVITLATTATPSDTAQVTVSTGEPINPFTDTIEVTIK